MANKRINELGLRTPQTTDLMLIGDPTTGYSYKNTLGAITANLVPYSGATSNVNLGEFGISTGYISFDLTPTSTPTSQGTMYWDDASKTVALIMNGTTQKIGLDQFYMVKNSTATTIAKGTAVGFAGTEGNSGHLLIKKFQANGVDPSQYYMGITSEDIVSGGFGKVMRFGRLDGVNTSAFADGNILYVSTSVAGGFQTSVPVAPNNIIVAAAVVSAGNNGKLIVRETLGSNINNDEGVKITTPTNGQVLRYNSTTSLWENSNEQSLSGYVQGSGVAGQVAYWNGTNSQTGSNNLFWNNTNARLGIGTNSPANTLDVNGTARVQGELTVNGVNIGLGGGAVSSNTRVGAGALNANTSGSFNSAFGHVALRFNTTGAVNVAFGAEALEYNTGSENTVIGSGAMRFKTTGGRNTAIGRNAGRLIADGVTNITIADNSIFLGYNTKALADNQTNQIVIGYDAVGLGSNTTVLGNSSTTFTRLFGNLGLGTSVNAGFLLDVNGTFRASGNTVLASSSGSVLINTTTDNLSGAKLQVSGAATISGNLGIGVTPSAWASGYKVIDISGGAAIAGLSNGTFITSNAYSDDASWKYKANSFATLNLAINGEHRWYTAPSGTAGNAITFTQAMTLNASGQLGIGTPTPTSAILHLNYNSVNNRGIRLQDQNGIFDIITSGGGQNHSFGLYDETNAAYRLFVTSTGRILMGTPTDNLIDLLQVAGRVAFNGESVIDGNNWFLRSAAANTDLAINYNGKSGASLIFYSGTTTRFRVTSAGRVNMPSLPTSSSGLSAGDLWNDGGTVKIV